MQILTYPTHAILSQHVAGKIVSFVNAKPDAVLCLASGDTPLDTFRQLAQLQREGNADFRRCTFVGLDEWVGMDKTDEGSCQYSLFRELFDPLEIPPQNVHVFNAKAADLQAECHRIDGIIHKHGGFDLMLVGVGLNGHIALNEPGTSFDLYSHVSDLAETTITVGQKYFSKQTPLHQGITLGLRHLLESREVILMASGKRKAEVIKQALEGPITEQLPASVVQRHSNVWVMLDEEAASLVG